MRALVRMGICLLAPLSLAPAAAQPLWRHVEQLTVEDGLSQSTVYGVLQDRQGFLWVGTQDGLNRYDGYRFVPYRHEPGDTTTLAANRIAALLEDRNGYLWVGTVGGGLHRYDPLRETFHRYRAREGPPGAVAWPGEVYALHEDRSGVLWVGGGEATLCRLDPVADTLACRRLDGRPRHGPSAPDVRAMLETQAGDLWVGTDAGLCRYDREGASASCFRHDPADPGSLSSDRVAVLHETPDGTLWVGTADGLNRWQPRQGRFARSYPAASGGLPRDANDITSLLQEGPGALWVGTNGGGLFRFETGAARFTPFHVALPASDIGVGYTLALCEDRTGILWAGTGGGGLFKLVHGRQGFDVYTASPERAHGLGFNIVRAFYQDEQGFVWVGTGGGLDRFDRRTKTFKHYRAEPGARRSLSDRHVRAVTGDGAGALWVGTYGGGVNRLDPVTGTRRVYRHVPSDPRSLSSDQVRALLLDRGGRLWVGTDDGLNRLDAGTGAFVRYGLAHGLPHRVVFGVAEDRAGTLWAATAGGLSRFDPAAGRFTAFPPPPAPSAGLAGQEVYCVAEDRQGRLWVGTAGGLYRIDRAGAEVLHVGTRDGLPNHVVYGIVEDGAGRLWLSTNGGLARFDPERWTFRSYDTRDGLPSSEFNAGAYYRAPDGVLYFGTIAGFVAFDPGDVTEPSPPPPVVLTGLTVHGTSIRLPGSITRSKAVRLAAGDNYFTVAFAALDYAAPAKNRFAYRLEGYDDAWVEAGVQPTATYTRVPPGTYTLHVKGANSDGVWNEEGVRLDIVILPSFWQTLWFRALVAAGVAGLLVLAFQYRLQQLLQVERTRTRIAHDLHDGIGSRISSIALLVEALGRSAAVDLATRYQLDEIAEEARQIVDDLRDTVWIIDARHDHLADLVRRIELVARKMLVGLAHRIELPEDVPPLPLNMEVRRHLLMICKEALHNLVRHSQATAAVVRVAFGDGVLVVEVRDDGQGFDEAVVEPGHGLFSMRERARHIGGRLQVRSRPGQGTSVTVTVKTV